MTRKRKLFDELMQGVTAMRREREGKITLRSHHFGDLSASKWTPNGSGKSRST
jgi:putative transcriptional regulator